MRVILTKEECHQNLDNLCDLIAKKAGLNVTDKTWYDRKKCQVSNEVQIEYFCYFVMKHPEVPSDLILLIWTFLGPRAGLKAFSIDEPYVAEVEDGFVVNP